jgi:UDP-hydrolysing UDP-N-acetyl-D-glucosamine 2-epimerase
MPMKKIAVVVASRANYGSIKMAMRAIAAHPDLDLQVIVAASAVLDRYGAVEDVITLDGFEINSRVYMLLEGETPLTMAKSTGLGLIELSSVFESLQPDCVITIGDRFETMATTIAAAYMNIPIAHTMGGEVTGTIDESIRHAVTKMAHIHFPANKLAAENIIRMGELPETVHTVGCPRIDLVAEIVAENGGAPDDLPWDGVGEQVDLDKPFLLVSQHPVTTEFGQARAQIDETLEALLMLELQTVMLWPNADAGADDVAQGIRIFREKGRAEQPIHFFKNLPPETYTRLMNTAACIVGNSSSSIREGAYLGVPAVNVGTRQNGRERGPNVIDVGHDRRQIADAVARQIANGRYSSAPVYGEGRAGVKIAEVLATAEVTIQKRLSY